MENYIEVKEELELISQRLHVVKFTLEDELLNPYIGLTVDNALQNVYHAIEEIESDNDYKMEYHGMKAQEEGEHKSDIERGH